MDDKKLTPEETVKALRCCVCDMPRCWECPARDFPNCSVQVRLRAAELLEETAKKPKRNKGGTNGNH